MTLQEFITKHNGQKVDFDGSFGAQCVDLYRYYCQEVLAIPQTPGVVGAYQLFETWTGQKFPNTPLGIPQAGDIMIWSQSYGGYGHVGIVTDATVLKFNAFEQNDPIGSACQVKNYSYKNVIGWLRPQTKLAITQNYKGELRIIPNELRANSEQAWEILCTKYNVDPKVINEII